ncbi:LuxR C-terminal-related transcriptional regulator [Streptomyces sp. S.PNR 29]|uniref:response regulator transcription factor n=1 Tax=Streptomyces sp. S.PNR 29 TaxID=2973805 RepID=UPI0025B202BA|nr:LuxR C-terminal-related transcriptional regulator [Streptomyces sp. S.PNR 29]MDN0199977.1 LuxR C-terminal-related transcriptional regulator [Streptomyces sp. S.PNR 29]
MLRSRYAETAAPDLPECGQLRRHAGLGLCSACWQRHPGRPFIRGKHLRDQLSDPPAWLEDFVAHVAARCCVARAWASSPTWAALHRVASGGTAIDPDLVARLFARHHVHETIRRLTAREHEVLSLMAQGLGNAAFAARLVITERAVHKHIRNIFAKLGLHPTDDSDRRVMAVLRYVDTRARDITRPRRG